MLTITDNQLQAMSSDRRSSMSDEVCRIAAHEFPDFKFENSDLDKLISLFAITDARSGVEVLLWLEDYTVSDIEEILQEKEKEMEGFNRPSITEAVRLSLNAKKYSYGQSI